jgi:hypothetical protein
MRTDATIARICSLAPATVRCNKISTCLPETGSMTKRTISRLAVAVTTAGLTGLGAATAAALPAQAAPASARYAIVCSGDVCVQTVSISSGTELAKVNAWARTTKFFGHFELQDIVNNKVYNSKPNKTWLAGGAHYTFKNIPTDGGVTAFHVIGWKYDGGKSYTDIGYVVVGS